MTEKELFFKHIAQTSEAPLGLKIVKAEGVKMWDETGKEYLDMVAGVGVCNIGHSHPEVVKAVQKQVEQYMHLIVYGEFIETPQVQYAKALTDSLPAHLNSVYFTNSGTESVEGAMKLAKRVTGRPQIAGFNKSYHGSTQGALSIMGGEESRRAYRPLLPGIMHLQFNHFDDLQKIDEQTAGVVAEVIQAGSGVTIPDIEWIQSLRERCTEVGALLILDEVQTGMGRTGTLWAFEQFDIEPDILLSAKSLGGGMPLGAFIADKSLMHELTHDPILGHITTFGGHPVSCTAGLASFKILKNNIEDYRVFEKEKLFRSLLKHEAIKEVRSRGLLIAIEFDTFEHCNTVLGKCIDKGMVADLFLFAENCIRLAPPLCITEDEIQKACQIILESIAEV